MSEGLGRIRVREVCESVELICRHIGWRFSSWYMTKNADEILILQPRWSMKFHPLCFAGDEDSALLSSAAINPVPVVELYVVGVVIPLSSSFAVGCLVWRGL